MKDISDLIHEAGKETGVQRIKNAMLPAGKVIQPMQAKTDEPKLPAIISCSHLSNKILPLPPELVRGLIHKGAKAVVGGGSKSYKTWVLVDLAISVATGTQWWGFETRAGKVLYVNFEIQEAFIKKRIEEILRAKGVEVPRDLFIWNLRGYAADFEKLIPKMISQIEGQGFSLIIIDPIYKGLGDNDENSAAGIGKLMNQIEKLAVKSQAAVVSGTHFSKGNQSRKESIDRISGSGVFGRDPDTILTLTPHDSENSYTVDVTVRDFPPIPSFCVEWKYPLMIKNEDLNPKELRDPGKKKAKFTSAQLLEVLGDQKLTLKEWREQTVAKHKMSERTFGEKKSELTKDPARVIEINKLWQKSTPGQ